MKKEQVKGVVTICGSVAIAVLTAAIATGAKLSDITKVEKDVVELRGDSKQIENRVDALESECKEMRVIIEKDQKFIIEVMGRIEDKVDNLDGKVDDLKHQK